MHQILLCLTCSTGTYRKRVWFSEWQDPNPDSDTGPAYEDTYYPPRLTKLLPDWHPRLPEKLQEVLRETYTALQHDLRYISTVGCRTAMDMAIVEKVGDLGAFKNKLEGLLDQKQITNDQKELILAIMDSGDAAAHRGFQPKLEEVRTLINILERLLYAFHIKPKDDQVHLEAARKINAIVPPRHPKPQRSDPPQ